MSARHLFTGLLVLAVAVLAGCGNQPRVPDWRLQSHGALERFVPAYFAGDVRVETAEFERVRRELSATGQPALVARAELVRCAARVASLDFQPCAGFEALREDAGAAERAYADYLAGRLRSADVALLPEAHRAVAASSGDAAGPLRAMADPMARLVAAGVLLQAGRASPETLAVAVDTASEQGWRRPLLAWLGAQARRAEAAGAADEAARIRRRIALAAEQR